MSRDAVGLRVETLAKVCAVLSGVVIFMLVAWVLGDPMENLRTDWVAFDNASDRLLAGEDVYRSLDIETEPLPYLYPPFALLLTLPLAPLGFFSSWAFSALLTASTFIAGIWFAMRSHGSPAAPGATAVIALTTGTFVATVLIAQYSGLYVLALGLGLWLWSRDRAVLAGLALAILLIKPNIGLAVPIILLWSRSWRTLGGFALGSALSFMISLAFGIGRWGEFFSSLQNQVDLKSSGLAPTEKMVTFVGGVQSIFGLEAGAPATVAIWLISSLIMGIATLAVWTPNRLKENLPRAIGVFALFVVAANPRLYFYDASVIVFGVFVLWHQRERLGQRTMRWLPVLSMALWVASWGTVFNVLNSAVAPLSAVLLVLVALDSRAVAASLKAENVEFAGFSDSAAGPSSRAA